MAAPAASVAWDTVALAAPSRFISAAPALASLASVAPAVPLVADEDLMRTCAYLVAQQPR